MAVGIVVFIIVIILIFIGIGYYALRSSSSSSASCSDYKDSSNCTTNKCTWTASNTCLDTSKNPDKPPDQPNISPDGSTCVPSGTPAPYKDAIYKYTNNMCIYDSCPSGKVLINNACITPIPSCDSSQCKVDPKIWSESTNTLCSNINGKCQITCKDGFSYITLPNGSRKCVDLKTTDCGNFTSSDIGMYGNLQNYLPFPGGGSGEVKCQVPNPKKCRTGYKFMGPPINDCYKQWEVYHEGGTRSGNVLKVTGLNKYGNWLACGDDTSNTSGQCLVPVNSSSSIGSTITGTGWTDYFTYGLSRFIYIPDDGALAVKCSAGHSDYDRSFNSLANVINKGDNKLTVYCTNSSGGNLGDAQTSRKTFNADGQHKITGVKWVT